MSPPPPPPPDGRKFCVTPTKTGYFGTDPPELAPKMEHPSMTLQGRGSSTTPSKHRSPRLLHDDSATTDTASMYSEKPSTSRMAQRYSQEEPPLQPYPFKREQSRPRSSTPTSLPTKSETSADEMEECFSASSSSSTTLESGCSNEGDLVRTSVLPTEHFCAKLRQIRCDAIKGRYRVPELNLKMNEMFVQRLKMIDGQDETNLEMKLITYQDWVDSLIQVNTSLINNMRVVEKEVKEVVEYNADMGGMDIRLAKAQSDICNLLRFIQKAHHNNDWTLEGYQFETITIGQILGQGFVKAEGQTRLQSGRDATVFDHKLSHMESMKALTQEVATKHDEVCKMKRSITSLEDEIQNAQKKIQLKDDVINKLRDDLRQMHTQATADATADVGDQQLEVRDSNTGFVTARDRLNESYTFLRYNESLAQQKQHELELELEGWIAMHRRPDIDTNQQDSVIPIFRRMFQEKQELSRRLDALHQNLINLNSSSALDTSASASGFQGSAENPNELDILETVHRRLQWQKDRIIDTNARLQRMEIDVELAQVKLENERKITARNKKVLKEIADKLNQEGGETFSYVHIYEEQGNDDNPFLDAITKISEKYQLVLQQINSNISKQAGKINDLEVALCGSDQQSITSETNTSTTTTITTKDTTETTTTRTTTTLTGSQHEGEIVQLTTTTTALPTTPLTPKLLALLQIQQVSDIESIEP